MRSKMRLMALCIVVILSVSVVGLAEPIGFGEYKFVELAGKPHDVVYDSTRNLAYVSNRELNRIDIVSLETNTYIGSIPVGQMPMGMAVSPETLLVTLYGEYKMSVVDLTAKTETKRIDLPVVRGHYHPLRVDFDASGRVLWRDGGGNGPYGAAHFLNLNTEISTRFMPEGHSEMRYSLSDDRSKILYIVQVDGVTVWDNQTQVLSPFTPIHDFGTSWSDWLMQGAVSNSGNSLALTRSRDRTYFYDGELNKLGSYPVAMGWGTYGPSEDIVIMVEFNGSKPFHTISAVDALSQSLIDSIVLPEGVGKYLWDDYDLGTKPIEMANQGESLLAVGETGLYIIDTSAFFEPKVVESLEIVGPDKILENSQAQLKAIARYDTGMSREVTVFAKWRTNDESVCEVNEDGSIKAKQLIMPSNDIVVFAEYTESGITVKAEKEITIVALCPTGYALKFDGENDHVNIPDSISLRLPLRLTVEAWVKPIYDGRDYYADAIIVKGENVGWGPKFNYRILMENQNLYTWGVSRQGSELFFHKGTPVYDKWQHLALVADGTKCSAYINGVEMASINAPGPYLTFEGYPLQIGGHAITNARWFSGLIDEVRIWNSARTVDEIKENMRMTPDVDDPNLVGYWDFDEGSGQKVLDLSGNNNHGHLGSTPDLDDSDPNWVASSVDVGICTLEGFVERNLNQALRLKENILDQLAEAIEKEMIAKNALDTALNEGSYGDSNKSDLVKAKQEIHTAIQHEEQAEDALEKSVENLDNAVDSLTVEEEPVELILTSIEFWPKVINLNSQRKWLGCVVTIGDGYDVKDVDTESIYINGRIKPLIVRKNEQRQDLIAVFDISLIWGMLKPNSAEFVVNGAFVDGSAFGVSGVVKVMK